MELQGTAREARAQAIPGEARRLVSVAETESTTLRVTGSVAVHEHCPTLRGLMPSLGRRPFQDIDLWGLDRQHRQIADFFARQGYVADPATLSLREWGIKRFIFEHPDTGMKVDVFLDSLVMAHTIPFAHRLSDRGSCITSADLLLSKLQIHELTANDIVDLIVLLGEQRLGGTAPGEIDVERVLAVLGDDWGFYYEAQQNLETVADAVARLAVGDDVRATVLDRIVALHGLLESCPKSRRWRLRAKLGTRKRWYEQVEEVRGA